MSVALVITPCQPSSTVRGDDDSSGRRLRTRRGNGQRQMKHRGASPWNFVSVSLAPRQQRGVVEAAAVS